MGYGKILRERYSFIRAIVRFQNSVFYVLLFAVLCAFSGLSTKEIYIPILLIISALIWFSAFFGDDNKVFFVPMLMIYYALGDDTDAVFVNERGKILSTFEMDGFVCAILCGVIMAVAVFSRLIADGTVKRALKRRGICFWSIIALDVAFLLNGAFSDKWVPSDLVYGAITCVAITIFYMLTLSMAENSNDPIPYVCKTLVFTSFAAMAQACIVTYKAYLSGTLIRLLAGGTIKVFVRQPLPWGVPTIVGMVICIGIPAALYLSRNHKYSFLWYMSAVILWFGTFIVNARSATLVGGIMLVAGVAICCLGGKNKRENIFYTLLLVCEVIVLILLLDRYVFDVDAWLADILKLLRIRDYKLEESPLKSRMGYWLNGLEDFKSSFLFGVGFRDGGTEGLQNVYSSMYHSVIVQFLGSMGIVGIAAFLFHLKHIAEIFIRRFSADKLLLLMVPLAILCGSFADNYFFYPNFQIIYSVFLGLAEYSLELSRKERLSAHRRVEKGRRPRVAFTYVEAGKGHIVPESAVCDSFKRKYGDRFEVVESWFYTETGDKKLEKTEKLFSSAVKLQNKNRIMSWLCKLGTWICGDTFALHFLMSFTFSGMQSKRRAKKHLRELDADLIFTTHWSVAYYASSMKNPPYVVMLCPDAYSNSMFNVDVNDLLIPCESGKRDAERLRMYAGGRVSTVDFSIRGEAVSLFGRKDELREELGIGKDEFVVTMSDGGYGLANMEATIEELIKTEAKLTVIALCGTNDALYKKLSSMEKTKNVTLLPVSFTNNVLRYIAVADLFCGKSGANSMAEPAFFGIPIIVTRSITYIERKIKKYYVKELKGALSIPIPRLAANKIVYFSENREELLCYTENLSKVSGRSGTDDIAELLCERIENDLMY